jgi:hypothetical protein
MVPSAFVTLDRLPVTPNGKLDRKALPAPEEGRTDLQAAYQPPRTPTEEVLAGIWGEVLGVQRVGVQDNFFELGGHSLLATRLISRVRRAFDLDLSLRVFFEAPTVEGMEASLLRLSAIPAEIGTKAALLLKVAGLSGDDVDAMLKLPR